MYTCIVYDGLFYFVNLTILKKIGFMKKSTDDVEGGLIESVPVVNKVSESLHSVGKRISKMTNSDVLEAIKYMGVEAFLKSTYGVRSLAWTSQKLGPDVISKFNMNSYNMKLLTGAELNKILINTVSLSILDILTDSRLTAKKTIKRILAQLPISYEKSLIGYSCECPQGANC